MFLKTFKRFYGWLKELEFRREYSLGDITGLYGILIGVAWSNELLTAGQQVNLHMTIDFVAPNVRTYNELAMAFDAFSRQKNLMIFGNEVFLHPFDFRSFFLFESGRRTRLLHSCLLYTSDAADDTINV